MNTSIHTEACCPQDVFADRALTRRVGKKATIGWTRLGERAELVFRERFGTPWIPVGLIDQVRLGGFRSAVQVQAA